MKYSNTFYLGGIASSLLERSSFYNIQCSETVVLRLVFCSYIFLRASLCLVFISTALVYFYYEIISFSLLGFPRSPNQNNLNYQLRKRVFDVSNPRVISENHKMFWSLTVISSCCEIAVHLLLSNLMAKLPSHLEVVFSFPFRSYYVRIFF